jgi:hypothetical protein
VSGAKCTKGLRDGQHLRSPGLSEGSHGCTSYELHGHDHISLQWFNQDLDDPGLVELYQDLVGYALVHIFI